MDLKNWNEIRDGFVSQSKNVLDFIEYCYLNNIKLPERECCSENEICYVWKTDVHSKNEVCVSIAFCANGTITLWSNIGEIMYRKCGEAKITDYIYEDLNEYFKENSP